MDGDGDFIGKRAGAALRTAVRAGAIAYRRERDLVRLIRLDPFVPPPQDEAGTAEILRKLDRALRAERRRAGSGRWTYDLNRHIALQQARRAEAERLEFLRLERRRAERSGAARPG